MFIQLARRSRARAAIGQAQLARRLGVDEKAVRRLPDPHHGSKLPHIAEAVQAPGKRPVVGLA